MKLEWAPFAIEDRGAIFDYIEMDNPQAAAAVDERIRQQTSWLRDFPEMGRLGRTEDTRELVIERTPYIVVYRIADQRVIVLRVLHGARKWPAKLTAG